MSHRKLEENHNSLVQDSIGLTRYGQNPINRYISHNLQYARKHHQNTDRIGEKSISGTKPSTTMRHQDLSNSAYK